MKDLADMNYSEFCLELSEDIEDRFQVILDYDDFQVIGEVSSGRYFYLEKSENYASDFFELECVATLTYDAIHDIKVDKDNAGEIMSRMFDCVCCGEAVLDDCIQYLWFERKRANEYAD